MNLNTLQMTFNVFNVEFEGIDKCGKDTLKQEMFKVFPNVCAYKARGILSQLAYSQLYHRQWQYNISEGYIQNSLFVYLQIDKDDWLNRLQATNEIEENKQRTDVDFVSNYDIHQKAFDDAWLYLKMLDVCQKYQDHFLCCNTSQMTANDIANLVRQRLILLNHLSID